MAEVTSTISNTRVGTSVRNKKSIYTATKVTGPTGTPPAYQTEIIRYSDAKGNNPVTIGTRNPTDGKINFNDKASATEKRYSASLGKTSTNQMNSPTIKNMAGNASEKEALNKSAGKGNEAKGSGNNEATPSLRDQSPEKEGTRNSFPKNLVFPITLNSVDRDVIKFRMMKYTPQGFDTTPSKRKKGEEIGRCILPVPTGIADNNNVNWGSGELNPIEMSMANVMLTGIQKGMQAGGEKAADILEQAKKDSGNIKTAISAAIIGSATNIGKQAMQRGEGMVLNPNMELLFGGPQLRDFTFAFKLSPRNSREAETVLKIIRFFKQGMAPIRSQSGFFLKAPHTFELEYMHRNRQHKALNKFKECALKNCGVQYTPDGNYNTYTDGIMTSYSLTLTFSELEPVFNDDYGSGTFPAEVGF